MTRWRQKKLRCDAAINGALRGMRHAATESQVWQCEPGEVNRNELTGSCLCLSTATGKDFATSRRIGGIGGCDDNELLFRQRNVRSKAVLLRYGRYYYGEPTYPAPSDILLIQHGFRFRRSRRGIRCFAKGTPSVDENRATAN